jgi:hypothetical protein
MHFDDLPVVGPRVLRVHPAVDPQLAKGDERIVSLKRQRDSLEERLAKASEPTTRAEINQDLETIGNKLTYEKLMAARGAGLI